MGTESKKGKKFQFYKLFFNKMNNNQKNENWI